MSLLSCQNICRTYTQGGQSIDVLKTLSFELAENESLAVTGASGAGKSTLLHGLGLLDNFDSGEFYFLGSNVRKLSTTERLMFRQQKIGFVFQFHYLMSELSALENVMLPLMIQRRNLIEARQQAAIYLDRVGLSHRLSHKPAELSGGEQQRVAIARALVHEPKLILADEPTGNLDPATAQKVFELFKGRCQELGASLIMATHHLDLANRLDRQLSISEGRLA